jgi:triosephosphate isomerase
VEWISAIIHETIEQGIHRIPDVHVTYFLPEALLVPARISLKDAGGGDSFSLGVQSVYRQDVQQNQNFGAFTSNRPAKAVRALGCTTTLIGHSEERKDKLDMLIRYDERITADASAYQRAVETVESLLREEAACALEQGMHIVYCIGETEQQKGGSDPIVYEPRVREVIRSQITGGLKGQEKAQGNLPVTLGYEPIWAIGPGKTPPGADYISFVSAWAKKCCMEVLGYELPVVYGGGLKEENAHEISGVSTIDGGLIALTKFTPPIAFDVKSLKRIILEYVK